MQEVVADGARAGRSGHVDGDVCAVGRAVPVFHPVAELDRFTVLSGIRNRNRALLPIDRDLRRLVVRDVRGSIMGSICLAAYGDLRDMQAVLGHGRVIPVHVVVQQILKRDRDRCTRHLSRGDRAADDHVVGREDIGGMLHFNGCGPREIPAHGQTAAHREILSGVHIARDIQEAVRAEPFTVDGEVAVDDGDAIQGSIPQQRTV